MQIIEHNCRELADRRNRLRKKFEARQKAMLLATEPFDTEIRDLQTQCRETRAAILANLVMGRELFSKKKTLEFAGIRVGFAKEQDTVTSPPEAVLVDRIEKMLPARQAETLLDRSVTVIKTAFKKLDREILQKLGCNIVAGADKPIVRANDDDIETLVQKSLGGAAPETDPAP